MSYISRILILKITKAQSHLHSFSSSNGEMAKIPSAWEYRGECRAVIGRASIQGSKLLGIQKRLSDLLEYRPDVEGGPQNIYLTKNMVIRLCLDECY